MVELVQAVDETEEEQAQRKLHTGNLYRYEHWRRSTARQLGDTVNGHDPATPPRDQAYFRTMPSGLYHSVVSTTCQSLAGERIALECSANLCAQATDRRAQMYLATQVADEARHVEVFTYRLGLITQRTADDAIARYANPRMEEFGKKLIKMVVEQRDFAAGVVGQNLALEGLALGVFDFTSEFYRELDPGYSQILEGVVADERRHVGFGVTRVREILDDHPGRTDQLTSVLQELSGDMLHMIGGLANIISDYGMDPNLIMDRVHKAHATHWRRIGLELPV